jgi:hypothetical protein
MICALELYKYFGAQDPLRFGSRMHKARACTTSDSPPLLDSPGLVILRPTASGRSRQPHCSLTMLRHIKNSAAIWGWGLRQMSPADIQRIEVRSLARMFYRGGEKGFQLGNLLWRHAGLAGACHSEADAGGRSRQPHQLATALLVECWASTCAVGSKRCRPANEHGPVTRLQKRSRADDGTGGAEGAEGGDVACNGSGPSGPSGGSEAKLDNDLGKIKTELQKAARAVDASLVASARAIAAFIKKNDVTEQLGTVFQHGPVRHTERSIMFGVCSGQKSQPPFSASTGNYGVPAKESNVGIGQGDTIAPMRNMIPLTIETHAVEWLVVGFQFVAPNVAQVSARVGVGMYVRQTPALIGYYYEPGRSGTLWLQVRNMLIPVFPESLLLPRVALDSFPPPSPPSPPSPLPI